MFCCFCCSILIFCFFWFPPTDYETTTGFLDKNKDFLVPAHPVIMKEAKNEFVQELVAISSSKLEDLIEMPQVRRRAPGTTSSFRFVGVASQFRVLYSI